MAVDEYLLGWTSRTGSCCWRFYQWDEPTLSLGYFQEYRDRDGHVASRECSVVRRASGGGAILHDRELTYCLTVPSDHPLGRRRQWTYEAVHRTLIAVLADWGIGRVCSVTLRAGSGKSGDVSVFQAAVGGRHRCGRCEDRWEVPSVALPTQFSSTAACSWSRSAGCT